MRFVRFGEIEPCNTMLSMLGEDLHFWVDVAHGLNIDVDDLWVHRHLEEVLPNQLLVRKRLMQVDGRPQRETRDGRSTRPGGVLYTIYALGRLPPRQTYGPLPRYKLATPCLSASSPAQPALYGVSKSKLPLSCAPGQSSGARRTEASVEDSRPAFWGLTWA